MDNKVWGIEALWGGEKVWSSNVNRIYALLKDEKNTQVYTNFALLTDESRSQIETILGGVNSLS